MKTDDNLSALEQKLNEKGVQILNHDISEIQQYLDEFAEKSQHTTKTTKTTRINDDGEQEEVVQKDFPIKYKYKKGEQSLDAIYILDETDAPIKMIRIDKDAKFYVTEHELMIYNTKPDLRCISSNALGLNTEAGSEAKNAIICFSSRNGASLKEPRCIQVGNCNCNHIAQHFYGKNDQLSFIFAEKVDSDNSSMHSDSFALYRYAEHPIVDEELTSTARRYNAGQLCHTVEFLKEYEEGFRSFTKNDRGDLFNLHYGFGDRFLASSWKLTDLRVDDHHHIRFDAKTNSLVQEDLQKHFYEQPIFSSRGILPVDILFSNPKYVRIFNDALNREKQQYNWQTHDSGRCIGLKFVVDKTGQYGAFILDNLNSTYWSRRNECPNYKQRDHGFVEEYSFGLMFSFEELLKTITLAKNEKELYENAADVMHSIHFNETELYKNTDEWANNAWSSPGKSFVSLDRPTTVFPLEKCFFIQHQSSDERRTNLLVQCLEDAPRIFYDSTFGLDSKKSAKLSLKRLSQVKEFDTVCGRDLFFSGTEKKHNYVEVSLYDVERSSLFVHKDPMQWRLELSDDYAQHYKSRLVHIEFDSNLLKDIENTKQDDDRRKQRIDLLASKQTQLASQIQSKTVSGTYDFSEWLYDIRYCRSEKLEYVPDVDVDKVVEMFKNGELDTDLKNAYLIQSAQHEYDALRSSYSGSVEEYYKTFKEKSLEPFSKIKKSTSGNKDSTSLLSQIHSDKGSLCRTSQLSSSSSVRDYKLFRKSSFKHTFKRH